MTHILTDTMQQQTNGLRVLWADTIFYSETDTKLKVGLNVSKSGAFGFYYVQSPTRKAYKWETLSTDINGGYDSNETGVTLGILFTISYKNFEFMGPSPIDFDTHKLYGECVWEELCKISLKQLKNQVKL